MTWSASENKGREDVVVVSDLPGPRALEHRRTRSWSVWVSRKVALAYCCHGRCRQHFPSYLPVVIILHYLLWVKPSKSECRDQYGHFLLPVDLHDAFCPETTRTLGSGPNARVSISASMRSLKEMRTRWRALPVDWPGRVYCSEDAHDSSNDRNTQKATCSWLPSPAK